MEQRQAEENAQAAMAKLVMFMGTRNPPTFLLDVAGHHKLDPSSSGSGCDHAPDGGSKRLPSQCTTGIG